MSAKHYSKEFKLVAVRQIAEDKYVVSDVAKRLDVTVDGINAWVKKY